MEQVIADQTIPETTRHAVVMARRGQGLFKQNVQRIEAFCRVTKVDRIEHLRASHCKPWRDASNVERLDGRSEEHTSELQSLMRISYAVFCLKKKIITTNN